MRQTIKTAFAVVVLTMSFAGRAWAGPLEDAVAARQRGDQATALRLFRPLADQGNAEAQFYLGIMYDNGLGVPQDHVEGLKWYRLAAEQGDGSAQYTLGSVYFYGEQGAPQDYVQSHMWFNLAASHFTTGSERAMAAKSRDDLAAKMTPAQIAEAQKLAREWKPK
jgi:uncharacterized protein